MHRLLRLIPSLLLLAATTLFAEKGQTPLSNDTISSKKTSREAFLANQRKHYYQERYYQPLEPLVLETYQNHSLEIQNFLAKHKHQSPHKPLIGIVTRDPEDLQHVNQLLVRIQKEVTDPRHLRFLVDEILAKVVAYRELQIGQTIPVPLITSKGKSKLIVYRVDTIFHLLGMPAFGLVPLIKKGAPILLFRGTDLSNSMKGYSSILADLDLSGPGLMAYYSAQQTIRQWLTKVEKNRPRARAIGYSLGGALVQYACILDKDLLSHSEKYPSVAFNQPGVSEDLAFKWNTFKKKQKPVLKGFITEGDVVSSVGKLIGNVTAMTLDYLLEPLSAHTTLMSAQQRIYTYELDVTLKIGLDYSAQIGDVTD